MGVRGGHMIEEIRVVPTAREGDVVERVGTISVPCANRVVGVWMHARAHPHHSLKPCHLCGDGGGVIEPPGAHK
jgi:hypothetical protein